jgi:hypothetical protein
MQCSPVDIHKFNIAVHRLVKLQTEIKNLRKSDIKHLTTKTEDLIREVGEIRYILLDSLQDQE